jgi:hypothetical protein
LRSARLLALALTLLAVGVGCAARPTRLAGPFDRDRDGEHGFQVGSKGLGRGLQASTAPLPPSGPPPADPSAASFLHYQAPGIFTWRNLAGETSVGINPKTNAAMFQMTLNTARISWDDSTSLARATWDNVSYTLTSRETLDPILWTDRGTGRTFVAQLFGETAAVAYTDDDGATWQPAAPPISAPSLDHETIGGGAFGSSKPPSALASYPHATYYCAQAVAVSQCARSDDGGATWGAPFVMDNANDCVAIHGHVAVGADGLVYVPKRACRSGDGAGQGLRVSRDNGVTWETRIVPATEGPTRSDPAISFDAAGRLYFVTVSSGRALAATTTDGGRSWGPTVDVGSAVGIRNAELPMIVGGDAGRAALAFYGTGTAGDDQSSAFKGAWHLYVAYTFDGGLTWTTTDTTPNDPVQRGCIWLQGGTNPCRNLYDFEGMTVDAQGRVLIGYADGCISAECISSGGKPADSRDSMGTIARQSTGRRLIAAFDPK